MDPVSASPARVARVNGPLVEVTGLTGVAMSDIVELGEHLLPGEAVAIRADVTTVQAYEYTGGLAPGQPARSRGEPLSARLGPHLLGGRGRDGIRPALRRGERDGLVRGGPGLAQDCGCCAPGLFGDAVGLGPGLAQQVRADRSERRGLGRAGHGGITASRTSRRDCGASPSQAAARGVSTRTAMSAGSESHAARASSGLPAGSTTAPARAKPAVRTASPMTAARAMAAHAFPIKMIPMIRP